MRSADSRRLAYGRTTKAAVSAGGMNRLLAVATLAIAQTGCATYWQASDLEEKVDRLLTNTRRETLSEIFGEQSREISAKIETLDENQKGKLDDMVAEYEKGNQNIDEVRSTMLATLGGTTRVVSGSRGIWVRDADGKKLKTIGRDTKLEACKPVPDEELPSSISDSKYLARYSWGRAQLDGEEIFFPWELTMSKFAKEIVENTARRTAQEVLRMSGNKGWMRPVNIKVITDSGESVTVTHDGAEEVFVGPSQDEPPEN